MKKMRRDLYLKEITKPEPIKHCAYCGKEMHRVRFASGRLEDIRAFERRKYCNRECMKKAFVKVGEDTDQLYRASHASAEKIAYLIQGKDMVCEKCGSTRSIDVHHIDGNRNNNTPENLMVLCRSCHMKEHKKKGVCKICGKPVKGHGYCDKHLWHWKKYGDANHVPWSQYKEKTSRGPVLQYTQDGVLVAEYKDLRTAERETQYARSSIASACNGNRKTLNGYIWKYGD